ncbi:AbiV family abortive infection protein [Niveispirillum sp.]|uniref:AbiV family abortive infection protein n=1 Tax=Niveispirillum sp. TaxID=1917217 RepID=UPI001B44E5F4|nr:AbiV family abortive infection protein [Niveispirillum sp.]MBP7338172.1 AbiV family abortive infection protein [Niveispirillum sp.]
MTSYSGSPTFLGVHIIENAERLLEDARILRKHRRYASTVAFTVLCLEEVAKFVSLNEAQFCNGGLSNKIDHKEKHRFIGKYLAGDLNLHEVSAILDHYGYTLKLSPIEETEYRDSLSEKLPELLAGLAGDELPDAVKANTRRSSFISTVAGVIAGHYNAMKKKAIYSEILERPGDGPAAIDRKTADLLLRLANKSVNRVRQRMRNILRYCVLIVET